MTYTTAVELNADQMASAHKIGEALIAMRKRTGTAAEYQTAMRESRERWGDDLHEVIKARGLMGATGGRA